MSDSKFIKLDNLSFQQVFDEEAELIPLMTPEDEEKINKEEIPDELSILPLRNTVLFPGVVIPITAGRDKSIQLIKDANKGNKIMDRIQLTENGERSRTIEMIRLKIKSLHIEIDQNMGDKNKWIGYNK